MSDNIDPHKPALSGSANDSQLFNFPTFMGCKLFREGIDDEVDVVITGVPFDLATTIRPGARFGPAAIRQASTHLNWELRRWPWDFSVFDVLGVVDCGDLVIDPAEISQMVSQLQQHASQILAAEKIMLTFGGDHFITLPLLREQAKKNSSIALIHFDAHTDTEEVQDQFHHGTTFSHAINEGIIDAQRSVQIGIRTEVARNDHSFTVLDAGWVMDHKAQDVLNVINRVVGDQPAYVSLDVDCLDPAFAPGTGTPVIGGLSSDMALKIIRGLVGCDLIGMDIVEVSSPYDHSEITSLAAATLGLEFLYVLAANRKAN